MWRRFRNVQCPAACASLWRLPSPLAMTHVRWWRGQSGHESTDYNECVVLCVEGFVCLAHRSVLEQGRGQKCTQDPDPLCKRKCKCVFFFFTEIILGQKQLHQNTISSKTTFIKNHFHQIAHFHQKTNSSKTVFIQNHVRQKTFSSKNTSPKNPFIQSTFIQIRFLCVEGWFGGWECGVGPVGCGWSGGWSRWQEVLHQEVLHQQNFVLNFFFVFHPKCLVSVEVLGSDFGTQRLSIRRCSIRKFSISEMFFSIFFFASNVSSRLTFWGQVLAHRGSPSGGSPSGGSPSARFRPQFFFFPPKCLVSVDVLGSSFGTQRLSIRRFSIRRFSISKISCSILFFSLPPKCLVSVGVLGSSSGTQSSPSGGSPSGGSPSARFRPQFFFLVPKCRVSVWVLGSDFGTQRLCIRRFSIRRFSIRRFSISKISSSFFFSLNVAPAFRFCVSCEFYSSGAEYKFCFCTLYFCVRSEFVCCLLVGRSVGWLVGWRMQAHSIFDKVSNISLLDSMTNCLATWICRSISFRHWFGDDFSVIDLFMDFLSPRPADQVMSPILSVMHLVTTFSVIDLMTDYLATWICRPTFVTNSFRHGFDDEFSRHFERSSVFLCIQKCKQWVPLTASQRRHRKGGDCGDFCQRMLPWTSLPSHVRRACCHRQKEFP